MEEKNLLKQAPEHGQLSDKSGLQSMLQNLLTGIEVHLEVHANSLVQLCALREDENDTKSAKEILETISTLKSQIARFKANEHQNSGDETKCTKCELEIGAKLTTETKSVAVQVCPEELESLQIITSNSSTISLTKSHLPPHAPPPPPLPSTLPPPPPALPPPPPPPPPPPLLPPPSIKIVSVPKSPKLQPKNSPGGAPPPSALELKAGLSRLRKVSVDECHENKQANLVATSPLQDETNSLSPRVTLRRTNSLPANFRKKGASTELAQMFSKFKRRSAQPPIEDIDDKDDPPNETSVENLEKRTTPSQRFLQIKTIPAVTFCKSPENKIQENRQFERDKYPILSISNEETISHKELNVNHNSAVEHGVISATTETKLLNTEEKAVVPVSIVNQLEDSQPLNFDMRMLENLNWVTEIGLQFGKELVAQLLLEIVSFNAASLRKITGSSLNKKIFYSSDTYL